MVKRLLGYLLIVWFLTACQEEPEIVVPELATVTPAPVVVRLGVASSAAPFAELIEAASWAGAERARYQFVFGPTETLYEDLTAGQLDGIFVHQIPAGSTHYFTPIALDALVPLIHPDNLVDELTQNQLRALFSGQINEWASLGGPDLTVAPLSRERGAGNRQIFMERVMVELPISINAPVPGSYEAMLAELVNLPGGIAFGTMGHPGEAKVVGLDGVVASVESVTAQTFPLTMPLYFVSEVEPAGSTESTTVATAELRAFIAWLQSADGQAVIGSRYGRVD